jgi:predicted deacetylase
MSAALRLATTQYLLRVDDLCPTMRRDGWERIAALVERYGLRPLLAIIPDNRDPEFRVREPDPDFWIQMQRMQSSGAEIGLHGYRHLCVARGPSLVPLHRQTEFAGAPEEQQRTWIRSGVEILRQESLEPRVWVAPRHGFDRTTLKVLREQGIDIVSDGFARRPLRWLGMTWIPQQLWRPMEPNPGLWTICLHPGSIGDHEIRELEDFLASHAAEFTSVERVLREWPIEDRTLADWAAHWANISRLRCASVLRHLPRRG